MGERKKSRGLRQKLLNGFSTRWAFGGQKHEEGISHWTTKLFFLKTFFRQDPLHEELEKAGCVYQVLGQTHGVENHRKSLIQHGEPTFEWRKVNYWKIQMRHFGWFSNNVPTQEIARLKMSLKLLFRKDMGGRGLDGLARSRLASKSMIGMELTRR